MQEPTRDMRKEAASAGFYQSMAGTAAESRQYPRIQLITVGELLEGKRLDLPLLRDTTVRTFKKAPKAKPAKPNPQKDFEDRF
jgi:hypothetical protein